MFSGSLWDFLICRLPKNYKVSHYLNPSSARPNITGHLTPFQISCSRELNWVSNFFHSKTSGTSTEAWHKYIMHISMSFEKHLVLHLTQKVVAIACSLNLPASCFYWWWWLEGMLLRIDGRLHLRKWPNDFTCVLRKGFFVASHSL